MQSIVNDFVKNLIKEAHKNSMISDLENLRDTLANHGIKKESQYNELIF